MCPTLCISLQLSTFSLSIPLMIYTLAFFLYIDFCEQCYNEYGSIKRSLKFLFLMICPEAEVIMLDHMLALYLNVLVTSLLFLQKLNHFYIPIMVYRVNKMKGKGNTNKRKDVSCSLTEIHNIVIKRPHHSHDLCIKCFSHQNLNDMCVHVHVCMSMYVWCVARDEPEELCIYIYVYH